MGFAIGEKHYRALARWTPAQGSVRLYDAAALKGRQALQAANPGLFSVASAAMMTIRLEWAKPNATGPNSSPRGVAAELKVWVSAPGDQLWSWATWDFPLSASGLRPGQRARVPFLGVDAPVAEGEIL